jgi:hypothetical protein
MSAIAIQEMQRQKFVTNGRFSCPPHVFYAGSFNGLKTAGNLQRKRKHVLPVFIPSISLRQLCVEVYEMASEEQVVLWCDS